MSIYQPFTSEYIKDHKFVGKCFLWKIGNVMFEKTLCMTGRYKPHEVPVDKQSQALCLPLELPLPTGS